MQCEEWRSQLDAYLDDELESPRAEKLMEHLRTCQVCTGEILAKVRVQRSVQVAGKRYAPSAEFRERILKSIEEPASAKKIKRWSFILVPAFAVVLAAILIGAYVSREQVARAHVYSELADLHVATLASSSPVDVTSSDKHTVKPWFQGKIPFTFNLPELAGSQFNLVGGRVFYLEQASGAHLIYQLRKHEISVFILPERALPIKTFWLAPKSNFSFQTETWTQNGLRYFALGDVNAEDLRALAKLFQDAK